MNQTRPHQKYPAQKIFAIEVDMHTIHSLQVKGKQSRSLRNEHLITNNSQLAPAPLKVAAWTPPAIRPYR
jgi:hypothetical protein